MATARDADRWVNFLEKAYAKAYGSYQHIAAGWPIEALHELTGAPFDRYFNDMIKNVEFMWKRIYDSDQANYIMVCNTGSDKVIVEKRSETGLIMGHAYSLLAAAKVTGSDGQEYRLVQLRNPWGEGEWNGAFSDDSHLWTEQAKKKVTFSKGDDGLFWMPIEDFCAHYVEVGIAKVYANFYHNNVQIKTNKDYAYDRYTVVIEVQTAGDYYFSVNQQSSRDYLKMNASYKYATINLVIGKVEPEGFKFVGGASSDNICTAAKCTINPGKYVAVFEVAEGVAISRNITFTSYGINIAGLQPCKLTLPDSRTLEYMIWRDYAIQRKGVWLKNDDLKQARTFSFTTEKADRFADYGVEITKFTPSKETVNQYKLGLCFPESKTGGPKDAKQIINLGKMNCGIAVTKQNGSHLNAIFNSDASTAKQSDTSPVVEALAQKLHNMQITIPTCNVPPHSNKNLVQK